MSAVSDEQVRRLVMLQAARAMVWSPSELEANNVTTEPPGVAGDMVELVTNKATGHAIVAAVEILLRDDPRYFTSFHEIDTFDVASTYRITMDGNDFDVSGEADAAATHAALAALIQADPDYEGSVEGGAVKARTDDEAAITISQSVIGGTGTWKDQKVDATSVTYRLWTLMKNRDAPCLLRDDVTIDQNTVVIESSLGPATHLAVQITASDGRVKWATGWADLEAAPT